MTKMYTNFATIDLNTLDTVVGGTGPGSRDFDVNKDGTGRVVDHNNGQHVGGPKLDPNKTVDFVPVPVTMRPMN